MLRIERTEMAEYRNSMADGVLAAVPAEATDGGGGGGGGGKNNRSRGGGKGSGETLPEANGAARGKLSVNLKVARSTR